MMRSYNVLLALSACFSVDLLVFTLGIRKHFSLQPSTERLCAGVTMVSLDPIRDWRYVVRAILNKVANKFFLNKSQLSKPSPPLPTTYQKKMLQQHFNGRHFHRIHVYRLAMVPVLSTIREYVSYDRLQLDLDDIDSIKWSRIRDLHLRNGNFAQALQAEQQTEMYKNMEAKILPAVEKIFVSSSLDKEKILKQYHCQQVRVLPNIYPIPMETDHRATDRKFHLLFVGLLGYPPNADAVLYFNDRILPLLRKKTKDEIDLQIINGGEKLTKQARKSIKRSPEVKLIDKVTDLGPYYRQASIVIVPLRAGGGTRIKVLEAFAYGVPVVSTTIGVEGLDAKHNRHVLIADTPADFAEQCIRLSEDADLRDTLVRHASSLLREKYSPARLQEILC